MKILNAIKLVCTGVDFAVGEEEAREAIEEASMVLQKEFGFDTVKVRNDLLDWDFNYKGKKYLK